MLVCVRGQNGRRPSDEEKEEGGEEEEVGEGK